ncbi:MAG: dockerin type I domain-containing protein, partial [Candidatus Borkfalkiaceae bacterium]|nr:dockerin type I domain-containing protein [Christensenellaceae bacterium]
MKTNLNKFSGKVNKRFAAKSIAATLTALAFVISVFGFVSGLFGFNAADKVSAQTVKAQSITAQTETEQAETLKETEQTDTEQATIEIESPSVIGGKSVDVKIDLKNSPGVASVICDVTFDESILTLNSFTYGEEFAKNGETPPLLNSPLRLCWSDLINVSGNKTFATLNFTAKKVEADCVSAITLTYEKSNVINLDEEDVEFAVKNGELTIKRGLPGDINGDGEVNAKDLIRLRKYFSGWEVEVDEVALDVNGDGEVNAKDLIRLRKYFAGWNVEIFYGVSPSVCSHSLNKVEAVAATCTAGGNDEYYVCEKCNKIFADETAKTELSAAPIIEANGHVEQILEAVAPTCTQTGLTAGKICAVCNTVLVEQEVINATGHTEVIDEAVEPTCTNTGLTQGKHCLVCGTVLIEQEVVPAKEHIESKVEIEGDNCTLTTIYVCDECGRARTEVCENHHYVNRDLPRKNCLIGARNADVCTVCGKEINVVPAEVDGEAKEHTIVKVT